jgi:hypothetical protein
VATPTQNKKKQINQSTMYKMIESKIEGSGNRCDRLMNHNAKAAASDADKEVFRLLSLLVMTPTLINTSPVNRRTKAKTHPQR